MISERSMNGGWIHDLCIISRAPHMCETSCLIALQGLCNVFSHFHDIEFPFSPYDLI
jgi:hypothetical protein